MKVKFTKEKETKSTFRYKAENEEDGISYIYISKEAVTGLGDPETIEVTVKKLK